VLWQLTDPSTPKKIETRMLCIAAALRLLLYTWSAAAAAAAGAVIYSEPVNAPAAPLTAPTPASPATAPPGADYDYAAQVFGQTRSSNCLRGCLLCTDTATSVCVKCSTPRYQLMGGACRCAPGRGGQFCQLCAIGYYSPGATVEAPEPKCAQCPAGFETNAPGSTSAAACSSEYA
jgi:hypothetical protein